MLQVFDFVLVSVRVFVFVFVFVSTSYELLSGSILFIFLTFLYFLIIDLRLDFIIFPIFCH